MNKTKIMLHNTFYSEMVEILDHYHFELNHFFSSQQTGESSFIISKSKLTQVEDLFWRLKNKLNKAFLAYKNEESKNERT